jgi:aspartyl-tRNA(Asn)/glutamyl-tRNA(Gln) amidotransferase subunit A
MGRDYYHKNMNFAYKSLLEIKNMVDSDEVSSRAVWDYFLARSEKHNEKLGAFLSIWQKGFEEKNNTPLSGIPLGIKDIFCEKGITTSGASKMLENYIPPYDATVIKKLNEAGMNSLGKCNMDEFAMWSSGENSAFLNTVNPHGTNRIPGGSSSWSAAAVAAGLVPAALGTDTGWSIRQPASMCGVVGFKPSYGRNSRFGVIPMASSLDSPGTFTRTVKDAAYLYDIMNGEDQLEGSSLAEKDTINSDIWESKALSGIKIGVPKEYFEDGLDSGVKTQIELAIERLKDLGAEIKEISLPMTKYAVAAYYIICPAEVTTNLARLDGIRYGHNSELPNSGLEEIYLHNRGEGLGNEPKRRSILWSYVLSAGFYDAYFKKAAQIRTLIIKDFKKAFSEVDMIVGPTAPSVAWKIGEISEDPLKMYLEDAYTIPASLAGLPGISLPCGFTESNDTEKELLPVGLQMLTARLEEEKLFKIANILEQSLNLWDSLIPKNFQV